MSYIIDVDGDTWNVSKAYPLWDDTSDLSQRNYLHIGWLRHKDSRLPKQVKIFERPEYKDWWFQIYVDGCFAPLVGRIEPVN